MFVLPTFVRQNAVYGVSLFLLSVKEKWEEEMEPEMIE